MKPQLPAEIELFIPDDVLRYLYKFVPHLPKPKKTPPHSPYCCSVSPSMERDLRQIQYKTLHGKSDMYLRDFDDFVLR